ncbi:MAG: hypothetical protein SVW02_04110 [Candidatus Nanohaloarchaea archaeon]|nr:hypothetical protein [Candidatus Nanohaloarchaea archaeon]
MNPIVVDDVRELDVSDDRDRELLRDFYGDIPEILEHYGVYGAIKDDELLELSTLGMSGNRAILAYSEKRDGLGRQLVYDETVDVGPLRDVDQLDLSMEGDSQSVYRALNTCRLADAEERGAAYARATATVSHPKVQGFMTDIGGVVTGIDPSDGRLLGFTIDIPLSNADDPVLYGDLAVYDNLPASVTRGSQGSPPAADQIGYGIEGGIYDDILRLNSDGDMAADEIVERLEEDQPDAAIDVNADRPEYSPAITALGNSRLAPITVRHLFDPDRTTTLRFSTPPELERSAHTVPESQSFLTAIGVRSRSPEQSTSAADE